MKYQDIIQNKQKFNYGLIGAKLGHSYSKQIHGFLGNNDYQLLELNQDELAAFIQAKDFKGLNVTIPYKQAVMPYCQLSEQAKAIGAVNTILNIKGQLFGYNTDYFGFELLTQKANINLHGKKVLILGSGATSKTVAAVALNKGAAELIFISRQGENNYDNIKRHYNADIIINTTPQGMYPNNQELALDLKPFSNLCGVLDVVYNPLKTNLILQAKELNIPALGGLTMLVGQALKAHNLFFGLHDLSELKSVLALSQSLFSNIVLIGMPGVGKSTIGNLLAKKLDMPFIDSDKEIFKQQQKTASQIIQEQGEPAFREIEAAMIKQIACQSGKIIATGGGSVLRADNRAALAQNGLIIYLKRDLQYLSVKDRPLSTDLVELFAIRDPIYQQMADHQFRLRGWPKQSVNRLINLITK